MIIIVIINNLRLQELFLASRALAETIGEEEDSSFNKFNAEPSLIRWSQISWSIFTVILVSSIWQSSQSRESSRCPNRFTGNRLECSDRINKLQSHQLSTKQNRIYTILKYLTLPQTQYISLSFSQLCQEDQVALLKGGCIELMVLRSVMNYDTEKHAWQIPAYSCLREGKRVNMLKGPTTPLKLRDFTNKGC